MTHPGGDVWNSPAGRVGETGKPHFRDFVEQRPKPDFAGRLQQLTFSKQQIDRNHTPIRFENVAQAAGITFQYSTGVEPRLSGRPMYSFPGGGVGVLDFDLSSPENNF